jgi:single-strand DNA-binding protein
MNNATFAGRIGRNAEVKNVSDKTVANFSLAVDEYAGQGEKKTLWIDCALWGDRATKLSLYLTKGTPVAVSGRVGVRTYDSNGETRAALTLRVSEVTLLGSKNDVGTDSPPASKPARQKPVEIPPEDDFDDAIPF